LSDDTQVLDAKRYVRQYKQHSVYVIISEKNGKPHSIQISASDDVWNRDQHLQANTDAMLRMATLALRNDGAKKVINELRNCALGERTLPAIVAAILEQHVGRRDG
jgi:hypothetical protein